MGIRERRDAPGTEPMGERDETLANTAAGGEKR
jgi:hypothetical protein